MRELNKREEEEEAEAVLKNPKSASTKKAYRYTSLKPSLYILAKNIPAKCYTDENHTVKIARWAWEKPSLIFGPFTNDKELSLYVMRKWNIRTI